MRVLFRILAIAATGALLATFQACSAPGHSPSYSVTQNQSGAGPQLPSSPTPAPLPAPTPNSSAYPDASNTGVPAGTQLVVHNGDLTIGTAGAVVDAMDIRGTVYITAKNITLKRSKVTAASYYQIRVSSGLTGVTVEDCEVSGTGSNNDGSYGILGPATSLRNNVHDVENGITPESGSVLQDNYIHGLKASGAPHYDGVQIDGGLSDIAIRHNTILNPNDSASAVMIDNYFGPINNIVVDDNLLGGGGYTVYCDAHFNSQPITDVKFTNNRLIKGGFGFTDFNLCTPVFTGNVNDANGSPIN